MAMPLKLMLVDDETLLRQALAMALEREPDIKVVAEVKDSVEAIRAIESHLPDLLILNMRLPDSNGYSVLQGLKKIGASTRVLVLTDHNDDEKIRDVLKWGVEGYCLKTNSYQEFLRAIRSILNGGVYLCPEIAEKVLSGYLSHNRGPAERIVQDALTRREKEVLRMVARGRRNADIAGFLSISIRTVQKHRANIMEKLDLHTTAELTAFALEKKL